MVFLLISQKKKIMIILVTTKLLNGGGQSGFASVDLAGRFFDIFEDFFGDFGGEDAVLEEAVRGTDSDMTINILRRSNSARNKNIHHNFRKSTQRCVTDSFSFL